MIFTRNSRLREGIELNAPTWENCTMFVQDLNSGANTAAEITQQEANNFRDMCKLFTSTTLHSQAIDEYLLDLSQIRADCSKTSICSMENSSYELSETSLSSLERFEEMICNADKPQNRVEPIFESIHDGNMVNATNTNGIVHSTLNPVKKSEDGMDFEVISMASDVQMNQMMTRTKKRAQNEQEIINWLIILLGKYDPKIAVTAYGSVTYGQFGGSHTNFNIFIITGTSYIELNVNHFK